MGCCKKTHEYGESNSSNFFNGRIGRHLKIFLGEFVGTAIILAMGCMGHVDSLGEIYRANNNAALTFGIATMISVRIFLQVSGGHVNPVITICSVLVKMTPILQLPTYWLGQFTGGIAGCALFQAITPKNQLGGGYNFNTSEKLPGVCSPIIPGGTEYYSVLIFEFFTTTILCWAWCSIWDYRNIDRMETSVFRYGITYNALILCGQSVSYANMNPARSLAPALLNMYWRDHWVFWAGPFAGSIVASLVYVYLLYESPDSYSTYWF